MEISQNYPLTFSTLILAAGKSSRMGVPKWGLAYDLQSTFLEHLIQVCHDAGSKEIVVVVNEEDQKLLLKQFSILPHAARYVINAHTEWDRFYSVKLGLQQLSNSPAVLICNIDNPNIEVGLIQKLIAHQNDAPCVYPVYRNQGGHPLLLSSRIIHDILETSENQLHFKTFLQNYHRKRVEVQDARILLNINSPEDYQKYKELFGDTNV
ncbi:MAG: NTP transferase domain-containing protein [Flavobacteriaceae bacterium]|nr:NTP transferase domain-containing protein [Flavobacteriaceae bacterium]